MTSSQILWQKKHIHRWMMSILYFEKTNFIDTSVVPCSIMIGKCHFDRQAKPGPFSRRVVDEKPASRRKLGLA
jgi:hypothetical protein